MVLSPTPGSMLPALGSVTSNSNNARLLDAYFGMVTDTQVANTYSKSSNGGLSLNAPLTSIGR